MWELQQQCNLTRMGASFEEGRLEDKALDHPTQALQILITPAAQQH